MLDIKDYLKAKHTPALFLMDELKGIREALYEMMKEKFEKDIEMWTEEFKKQMMATIKETADKVASQSVFKGDSPTKAELLALIYPLIPSPIKGDSGHTPIAGVDFELPEDGKTPTSEELKQLIKPLIPKPIAGSEDTGKEIVKKINELPLNPNLKIDASHIKNLPKAKETKGGGGMGNVQHESKNVGISTTTVTTTYKIAGGGFAVWAHYQGQLIMRGTQYTVGSDFRTLTLTFTLTNNTIIDI